MKTVLGRSDRLPDFYLNKLTSTKCYINVKPIMQTWGASSVHQGEGEHSGHLRPLESLFSLLSTTFLTAKAFFDVSHVVRTECRL